MKLRGVDKFLQDRGPLETADGDQIPDDVTKCKSRIMYIENKSGGLEGPARIGRVYYSKILSDFENADPCITRISVFEV